MIAPYHLLAIPSLLCSPFQTLFFALYSCHISPSFVGFGETRKRDSVQMKGFVVSLSNGGANWERKEFIHILLPSQPVYSECIPNHIRNNYTIHSIAPGFTDNNIKHNANHLRLPYHIKETRNKKMAQRAPASKKAKSKAPAKTPRTRLQRRNERLVVRDIPVLPPTFRCWFCIGEKRLGEKVPYSRTLPICRMCQEHFTRVASERDTDTHPAAANSGSASRPALPSSSPLSSTSHLPRPRHLGFPSHPLRPAVVIDPRKGLKKKIMLRLKGPSKKPDVGPTSNERREDGTEVRRRLPAPRKHPRPILFLSLPKPTGEDGGKILLRFRNPLRNKE